MAVTPGTRLGSYEIAAQIGVGGMGEVYQAKDTNLGRDVAIKLLPEAFSQDAERLARFEREARTLASLNHPNIAIIHGLERIAGVRALVMELVDGPTLADRIAQGPIPTDEAAPIARQIADALEAAHEQGIVHRDLKPANVKVRPDGVVKVLDFGLAKLNEGPASASANATADKKARHYVTDPTMSPTITSPAMTGVGVILGTAAYMAPEQAAGKATDRRADIWSFGVVLWEMLTGERLFASAESTSHVLADVLRAPIAFDRIPAGPLQDLVRRCLDRDVKSRLRDIGEARIALSRPLTASTTRLVDARQGTRGARVAWAVAAALVIFAGVALWAPWRVEPDRPLVRLEVDLGPEVALSGRASRPAVALSPDGRRLAYAASVSGGPARLYVRELNSGEPMELAGTEGVVAPALAFSPDSRFLVFTSPAGGFRVSVDGGAPIRLTANLGRGLLSWGSDGSILAWGQGRGVGRIPPGGGDPVEFTKLQDGDLIHAQPHILPGGKAILFAAAGAANDVPSIEAVFLASGQRKRVVPSGGTPHYLPSGHLLYMNQGTIFAVRFDADTLETRGEAVPMVTDVKTTLQGQIAVGTFSISDNGTLVYRKGPAQPAAVGASTRVDIIDSGGKRSPLIEPGVGYRHLRFSPDGNQLALTISSAGVSGRSDVWMHDRRLGGLTRLSFDGGDEPAWSRDGRYLVFSGAGGIFWTRPGSGGPPQRLLAAPAQLPWSLDTDGKRLAYSESQQESGRSQTGRGGRARIFTVPITEEGDTLKAGTPERFSPLQFAEGEAAFSPDNRWIAFATGRSDRSEVMVRAFPLPASGQAFEVQVSNNGGEEPRWSRTSQELLYVEGDRLMAASYTVNGDAFVHQRPRVRVEQLGSKEWDLALDGRIAVVTPIQESTAASQAPPAEHTVVFLQNFDAEVRRRVK